MTTHKGDEATQAYLEATGPAKDIWAALLKAAGEMGLRPLADFATFPNCGIEWLFLTPYIY